MISAEYFRSAKSLFEARIRIYRQVIDTVGDGGDGERERERAHLNLFEEDAVRHELDPRRVTHIRVVADLQNLSVYTSVNKIHCRTAREGQTNRERERERKIDLIGDFAAKGKVQFVGDSLCHADRCNSPGLSDADHSRKF
jgi:hypothetical protein